MITALIMAGGEGTRFWPLSRADRPKQFLNLADEKKTMLQITVDRISEIVEADKIFVATNVRYKKSIMEQLPAIPEENIIIEPYKRNTAPSIGLSSMYIDKKYPGATMLVLPADHLIKDKERFLDIVEKAVMVAAKGDNLVTMGIKPTHPETGYGYIHFGECYHTIDNNQIYRVKEFTEKPDYDTAEDFFKSGQYLWNSGMFVWQVETIMKKIKTHLPDLYDALERMKKALGTDRESKVIKSEFEALEGISIDYGIMEKAENIFVIPGSFGWDDLGSWPALERVKRVDENGNVIFGKHYGIDTEGSMIHSSDKVVTTIGMKDVIIVNTEDALLVCDKKRAQEVKQIRNKLKEDGMDNCL